MEGLETTVLPEDVYQPPPRKEVKQELAEGQEGDEEMGHTELTAPTPLFLSGVAGSGAAGRGILAGSTTQLFNPAGAAKAEASPTEEFEEAPTFEKESRLIEDVQPSSTLVPLDLDELAHDMLVEATVMEKLSPSAPGTSAKRCSRRCRSSTCRPLLSHSSSPTCSSC